MASHDRAQRCPLGIRSHLSSTPRCRCTGAKTLHRGVASTISPRSRYVAGSRHSSRPRSVQCWDALPPARHMFAAAAVPGRCTGKMRTAASIIYPHGYLCRSTARVDNPFMPNWNYQAPEPVSHTWYSSSWSLLCDRSSGMIAESRICGRNHTATGIR